jgi:hypothetical protein
MSYLTIFNRFSKNIIIFHTSPDWLRMHNRIINVVSCCQIGQIVGCDEFLQPD